MYVGRSALEIKLRETPFVRAYGAQTEPVPMAIGAAPTERISRDAADETSGNRGEHKVAPAPDRIERGVLVARSTLVGLCLTAFACGIVVTVGFDHHHLRALEREARSQVEAVVVASPPVTPPAAAEAPKTSAPATPDPVVEQIQPAVASAPIEKVADKLTDKAPEKAASVRATAARAPRSPVARAAVRRRSPAASAPAGDEAPATAWVDPFAE